MYSHVAPLGQLSRFATAQRQAAPGMPRRIVQYHTRCCAQRSYRSDVRVPNTFHIYDLSENQRWEMSCRTPRCTGLPMAVCISCDEGFPAGTSPRMRVSASYDDSVTYYMPFFLVTLEEEPKVIGSTGAITIEDVQKTVEWVRKNKAELLAVWTQDLDCFECRCLNVHKQ